MALGPNITDLDDRLAGNLLLDVEVVILHIRGLNVAIVAEGVALVTAARAACKYGLTGNDGPTDRAAGEDGIGTDVVIGRPGIEVGRIRQMAHHHVLRESVVEHSEAGADNRLSFSSHF